MQPNRFADNCWFPITAYHSKGKEFPSAIFSVTNCFPGSSDAGQGWPTNWAKTVALSLAYL